jgi:hypothetical protein
MITRDNYEEFFLLYIDNELSVADREAVERFIAHHPDLQKDWKALLHCRLLPDEELVFPDREALYGIGALEGEDNNNDLPVFSPDLSIVFPDKASLYKKEEDKRIIWLPWLRVGVAAAMAGIVALLVLLSGRHTSVPSAAQPVVKNNKIDPAVTPAATDALHSIEARDAVGTKPGIQPKPDNPVLSGQKEKKKKLLPRQDVQEEKESVSQQDLAQQAAPHDPVHDPTPVKPTDITATRAADITATKAIVTTTNVHSSDAVAVLQTVIPREESSFATQALQHENENHDPENNILVADESPAPGKGKLRGLFRRVTRTFGKTADRDSDGQREVLVGAFQIALK